MPFTDPVFLSINVDFLVLGGARISWTISPRMNELEPWWFQIQVAESEEPTSNWVNVPPAVANTFFKIDSTRRAYGKELNVFYRVLLTTAALNTYISPPAVVLGDLDFQSWNRAREIIRKERLRLNQLHVGAEGYILKSKQSGTPCPVCLDQFTKEVTDSNCPTCFGQRWVGGFYAPTVATFVDLNPESVSFQRDVESGHAMINPQAVEGLFLAEPFMSTTDIWVSKTSDVRYYMSEIKVRTHMKHVPLLSHVTLRPIPFDQVVYSVPVPA